MVRKLNYKTYFDRIYGGWYGKCLGGAAGAPVEGFKKLIEIDDFIQIMNPDLPNDDLDIQLLWLEVLRNKGPYFNSCDLADAWIEKCWYPFSEYGYFIKNYKRGIKPPYSGNFNNLFFKEGMGSPIRSEIWGFVFPGNPKMAAKYAGMDAILDHADNSLWAEQMLAVIESMIFFETDMEKLLEVGLNYIPKDCKLSKCITTIMDCYKSGTVDWISARSKVISMYGHMDFTNSIQNMGFIAIALLYGQCDLRKTINIALKCGYDADCTCATSGAIVGGILGFEGIGKELTNLIKDYFVCGIDINRENNSIKGLSEDVCRLGVSINAIIGEESEITGIPPELDLYNWEKPEISIELGIEYIDRPSIGYNDRVAFNIKISNISKKRLNGNLIFDSIPENWVLQIDSFNVLIAPGETQTLTNEITTADNISIINNTNILRAKLLDHSGFNNCSTAFGIAGASIWKGYGPFFEQLDKISNPNHPSPHQKGCVLPSVECMVNNAVYLDVEYIDEKTLDFSTVPCNSIINAYEDLIPAGEAFSMEGQYCVYLTQEIISPDDREVWGVVGNNDGFRLWVNGEMILEKDEIRYWTPYNNCELVRLEKGINFIVLKLLRRTSDIKFSLGLRKYEGEHWHKKQWYTDLASKI